VQGHLEGADAGAIADQLFRTGVTPIEIIAAAGGGGGLNFGEMFKRSRDSVSHAELILFSRQMYTLSKAGVPMLRALAGLEESATNPGLAHVLHDIRASLDSGHELSAAMKKHPQVFDNFYVSMIRVGEMTGRIEQIFDRLASHMEFEGEMRARVKSALRYPTFVIAAMAIAIGIANIFIIPIFAKMYEGLGSELPTLTKVLIGFSNFTVNYWWLVVMLVGGAVFSFKSWVATEAGQYSWDKIKMDLPLAGKIVTKATLARFARSFALSIQSGVPLVQALNTVAEIVDNKFVREKILAMRKGVESGESVLRVGVAAGVFSPVVLQMIAVGEETGALDEMMIEIATLYERDVEYDVKGLSAQIEPILIIFLAAFVAVLALGILSPMWGMHKAALNGK
jgi:MSHA biogenesis protein MshG